MNTKSNNIWIQLSLSDLNSARILYEQKQFRTSYFLFQQAAEKANKGFAKQMKMVNEEDFEKIGHDQFKIYRKGLIEQEKKLAAVITSADNVSTKMIADHNKVKVNLSKLDKYLDKIKKEGLRFSSTDLNKMYKEINLYKNPLHKRLPPGSQKSFDEMVKKTKTDSKNAYIFVNLLLYWVADLVFIITTLASCAELTAHHSSATRYPKGDTNPIDIYTRKLPLIKKQPLFMSLLEEALKKIIKNEKSLYEQFEKALSKKS